MTHLLTCPFCGGEAKIIHGEATEQVWVHGNFSRVYCTQCQSRQLFYRTDAEAINAWNARVAVVPSREQIARIIDQRPWLHPMAYPGDWEGPEDVEAARQSALRQADLVLAFFTASTLTPHDGKATP